MLCEFPNGFCFNTKYIVTITHFLPEYDGHLIYLIDGNKILVDKEDFRVLEEVLVKEEGLMMPDPQESEGVLSNDPWRKNGQQGPKDGKDSTE